MSTTTTAWITVNLSFGLSPSQIASYLHGLNYNEYGTKAKNVVDPNWNSDLTKFQNVGNTSIQQILVDMNNEIIGWRCQ